MVQEDGRLHDASAQTDGVRPDGQSADSQSQAESSPVARRDVVRRLGVSSALAAAGLVAFSSPAAAETLSRTQPRRFRLAPPPVGEDTPSSAIVNKGYVDDLLHFTENIRTGNHVLTLSDAGKVVAIDSSSDRVVTVPSNASTPFPIGTIVNVYRAGAGKVTVGAASGVTVRNSGEIAEQYSEASLRKRAINEWVLSGNVVFFTPITATGGTMSTVTLGGVTYRVHSFTTVGTSSFVVSDLGTDGRVDFIAVAGGGSGGNATSGGGGAGGLVFVHNFPLQIGSNQVTVGAGGARASGQRGIGSNGNNTSVLGVTAIGGGRAASNTGSGGVNATNGGSGGGGSRSTSGTNFVGARGLGIQPASASGGFGSNGGANVGGESSCGGGGAGEQPSNGQGPGGQGLSAVTIGNITHNFSATFGTAFGEVINGESFFAGGGGGSSPAGPGGNGGGGDANPNGTTSRVALANTGGGGGGNRGNNSTALTEGGSGIVILRYPITDPGV